MTGKGVTTKRLKVNNHCEVSEQTKNEPHLLKTTYYGERMSPKLNSGDQVILRKINPRVFIEWGEIYMIQTNEYDIFCRLTPGSDNNTVKISYDNPNDKVTQEIPLTSISNFWRLIATARLN